MIAIPPGTAMDSLCHPKGGPFAPLPRFARACMFRTEQEVSMISTVRGTSLVAGTALLALAFARTPTSESGSALYASYCASCHGKQARGDGPLAANLRIAPADLTHIARRNHGKYEPERVRRAIDGRGPREVHGGSEMPVWGDAFKRSGEGYSEAGVKERIDALVEYLETIQEK